MDFLSNLNLHELPEQQTKINEKISFALEDNPDLRVSHNIFTESMDGIDVHA